MRIAVTLLLLGMPLLSAHAGDKRAPVNPFYAMDTAFRRPGTTLEQQLDLLKDLGYAGIAWTGDDPEPAKKVAEQAEKRGLKMFTIYCAATVTPDGKLSHSANLPKLMAALRPHGTIIWLHIGGKGPAFDTLKCDEPLVKTLRELAADADGNSLSIAVYPHVGEWTERVQNAVRLAKTVDRKNFCVTFNLCHCLAMGDETHIPELLAEARPYLKTVTINGADAGVKGAQWNRLIQTLDKGSYDVGIVLRALKKLDFQGPIGFQGYGISGDSKSIVGPTMAAWKKVSTD
jgi:sugar phosphate isomerase/epimerase